MLMVCLWYAVGRVTIAIAIGGSLGFRERREGDYRGREEREIVIGDSKKRKEINRKLMRN